MAMQLSMKLQQQYAELVARGDELFTGIRGEDEPGLATFDDDEEDTGTAVGAAARVGTSAFDRVAETVIEVTEDDEPAADEVLDELAIEELVDEAPGPDRAAELADAMLEGEAEDDAEGEADDAPTADDISADVATPTIDTVDVPAADGGVETVEATVTDEGVAAPEAAPAEPEPTADTTTADSTTADSTTASTDDGAPAPSSAPPATAPVDGYDDWSIAQLRGRLRGYQAVTVQELLDYEQATKAREPYLRMLRNRLEKLDEQAVESSPLAPRGA